MSPLLIGLANAQSSCCVRIVVLLVKFVREVGFDGIPDHAVCLFLYKSPVK